MKAIFLYVICSLFLVPPIYSVSFVKNEKKTINKIINQAEQLRDSSYTVSIKIGKQAINLALTKEKPSSLAASYKSLGVTYYYQGLFDSAYYYYEQALEQFKIDGDSLNIGKITGNIGIVHRRTGKYDKALQQYLKAMEIYQNLNYQKGLGGTYLNIGGLYQTLENKEKALCFYQKARNIFITIDNKKRLSRVLTNMGVIKYEQGHFQEALDLHLQNLEINDDFGMLQHKAIIHQNIGQTYQALGEPLKALEHYMLTENIRTKLNDIWGFGKLYLLKAETFKSIGKFKDAETCYLKAKTNCTKNKLTHDLKETYYRYSLFLQERNQFKKSIIYFKKYNHLKDSLQECYRSEIVEELTAKYESEQQEKEFQLLQQKTQIQDLKLEKKNAWIITLMILILLGIISITVSMHINQLSVEHQILDLRQKVLLTQMNPHFLFNSLTAIQSFILDKKNDDANLYLSKLASLVRGILENSRQEFVSLETELESITDYIGLQKLRFENEISYWFEIDEEINREQTLVPPMLAQPFVENALLHGDLRNNPKAEIRIKISLNESKDILNFQIKDNGIGIEQAQNQSPNTNHKSLASSIALDRVKIYNFRSSKKMHFEIVDLKTIQENGTLVTYTIPFIINKNY